MLVVFESSDRSASTQAPESKVPKKQLSAIAATKNVLYSDCLRLEFELDAVNFGQPLIMANN